MISLTLEQYTALISLGRKGVGGDPNRIQDYELFLRDIEKANKITRYAILVRWQELNEPLPPHRDFPRSWPPERQTLMERTDRPIARKDLDDKLKTLSRRPEEIMVTRDLGGIAGWTKVDEFFK